MFDWLISRVDMDFIAQGCGEKLSYFRFGFLCRASSRVMACILGSLFVIIDIHSRILFLLPSNLTCTRVRIHTSDTLQYPIPFKTIYQHHMSAYVTTSEVSKVNDMIHQPDILKP